MVGVERTGGCLVKGGRVGMLEIVLLVVMRCHVWVGGIGDLREALTIESAGVIVQYIARSIVKDAAVAFT